MNRSRHARVGGTIVIPRAGLFWSGVVASTAGVLLHLPMYWSTRQDGFRMAGMRPDGPMIVGMALVIVGLTATVIGLLPRRAAPASGPPVRVQALDDAPISPALVVLLCAMALAVTIDTMKPITLSFVAPGMAKEYGLRSAGDPHGGLPVALLPLAGIAGTVIGSFMWGWLGDRIGRRSSILMAAALFTTTSICGAMPGFSWNLLMCFIMGIGAGGMLPITFTLLAEIVPARHRGWLMVLIGGELAAAYAIVSALTAWLVPHYSWRIMWLIGLPTGLLLVLLNRWIPESPRFLLASGRNDEAEAVLRRYGAEIVTADRPAPVDRGQGRYSQLLQRPFTGVTSAVVLLGLGAGLITFGFQLWIPTNLQRLGLTEVTAAKVLRDSAVLGLPLSVATAWLYGFWSSRKTIILLGGLTAASLFVFAAVGDTMVDHRMLLNVLLIVPIWGNGAVVAVLAAYGSEVYPTRVRARGTGLAAGISKAAGIGVILVAVAAVAAPSLAVTALLGAIPLTLAVVAIGLFGVETRRHGLEEIAVRQLPVSTS